MRSTLFFLPHEVAGLPLFGIGWALILLILWAVIWSVIQFQRGGQKVVLDALPAWGVAALVVIFLFPRMETQIAPDQWLGLPVRGYGIMLMLGVLSGVGLTAMRSKYLGINFDQLLSLAFFSCVSGIAGARIFYVVQKWSELSGETLIEKLVVALKFTEGGLVVYGGMIGGLIACWYWCRKNKKSMLALADLVAPGFLVGLCLGRLGCFLHGCCYGGICLLASVPTVQFPSGSEPYMAQLLRGELIGLKLDQPDSEGGQKILAIEPNSWGEKQGLKVGQVIEKMAPRSFWPEKGLDPAGPQLVELQMLVDGKVIPDRDAPLPAKALPLHPAQIYSSINAILIAGILFFAWPYPKRDGYLFAGGLCLYGMARCMEEWIRADELGFLGSPFTISQWISLIGIVGAIAIFVVQSNRPAGRFQGC